MKIQIMLMTGHIGRQEHWRDRIRRASEIGRERVIAESVNQSRPRAEPWCTFDGRPPLGFSEKSTAAKLKVFRHTSSDLIMWSRLVVHECDRRTDSQTEFP